jgi:hypothetical protein
MFALQTCLPQYSTELWMTIRPQRESTTTTTTFCSHQITVLDKVIQTTQAEGVFLKGEDNIFFSLEAFIRILLERSACIIMKRVERYTRSEEAGLDASDSKVTQDSGSRGLRSQDSRRRSPGRLRNQESEVSESSPSSVPSSGSQDLASDS